MNPLESFQKWTDRRSAILPEAEWLFVCEHLFCFCLTGEPVPGLAVLFSCLLNPDALGIINWQELKGKEGQAADGSQAREKLT
ncbi:MAG: hypothetical protein J6B53_00700 [Clostridia bacterium]|nr:hypothetical protein [Clostridia bacterium]